MKIYICSDIQIHNLKINFTPYILVLFFFVNFSLVYGQKFQLKVSTQLEENNKILKRISFIEWHDSEASVHNEIGGIKSALELKGFLNTSLDTSIHSDSIYKARFFLGNRIEDIRIFYINSGGASSINLKNLLKPLSKEFTDTYIEIPFEEVTNLLRAVVNYFEEAGNSFTEVTLENIVLKDEVAEAHLKITATGKRTIDKVIVKGYEGFPDKYIRNDLNLKINTVFNDAKLLDASSAIITLPFVEEIKSPEVLFTDDSTYIYLYLKKKRSNKFDGVLGFASKEDSEGINFNGYIDFTFNNLFNGGESVAVLWKNNGNNSQRFFISVEIPYIFNLPITPKAEFEIFRQDTIYNNITTKLYLSYFLNNKNKITGVFNTESSNDLLKVNDPDLNVQSYKNLFFGITYDFRVLNNDILFPEKFRINISGLYGSRKIENENTSQSKFFLIAHYLLSLNAKNYLFFQNQSALLNSENYYNNELFRIGGVNTIRGFNEESIFVSAYSILNLEYRFKPNNSSYFYTISDFGYVADKIIDQATKIYSLGFGYSFITKIGLLNLSYAIGKFGDQPFNFGDSKLHIKLISIF